MLREAFVATVEVLDRYAVQGLVTGTAGERIWDTGEVLRDYSSFSAVGAEAEAELVAEVEELQRSILGDDRYERLKDGIAARDVGFSETYEFAVPGLGRQDVTVVGFGYLLFWHRYSVAWVNLGGQSVDTAVFKLHDTLQDEWVSFSGSPHLDVYDANHVDETWSNTMPGFRNQFIGLDDMRFIFTDALVPGGTYTYIAI